MTFVFVLTSTTKDLYYEQALMSAFSLRKKMPSAEIAVLTDNKTFQSFTEENKRTALSHYVSKIISVDFDDSVPNVDRSRLIKSSIPDYIEDSFLYIDCDTVICDDLSDIEKVDAVTGGVLDGHCMLDEHIHKKYFLARDKKLGFSGTALRSRPGGTVICRKEKTAAFPDRAESAGLAVPEIFQFGRSGAPG